VWLNKYLPKWKPPHNWPMNLAIEFPTICDIYSSNGPQMRLYGSVRFVQIKNYHLLALHHPQPLPICNHLWYWCKIYLKWWAICYLPFPELVNWKRLYNYRLTYGERHVLIHFLAFSRYVYSIKYFNWYFLIYVIVWTMHIFKAVTYKNIYQLIVFNICILNYMIHYHVSIAGWISN